MHSSGLDQCCYRVSAGKGILYHSRSLRADQSAEHEAQ